MLKKILNGYSTNKPNTDMEKGKHIHKEIFQDDKPPAARKEKKNHVQKDYVMDYLLSDFQSKGYKHGYADHHEETRSRHINIIKGEFDIACERMKDIYSARIDELLFHLIKVKDSSPSVKLMVEKQLESYRKRINELSEQLELAKNQEGKVALALMKYIDGFNRGLADYTQEQVIGNPTGFFQ